MTDDPPQNVNPAVTRRHARLHGDTANPIIAEMRAASGFGELSYKVLIEITRSVAVSRGYPPPQGHRSWTKEAIAEVAHDWLTNSQPERTIQLLATVTNGRALTRYLETSITSALNSEGRMTDRGSAKRATVQLARGPGPVAGWPGMLETCHVRSTSRR